MKPERVGKAKKSKPRYKKRSPKNSYHISTIPTLEGFLAILYVVQETQQEVVTKKEIDELP